MCFTQYQCVSDKNTHHTQSQSTLYTFNLIKPRQSFHQTYLHTHSHTHTHTHALTHTHIHMHTHIQWGKMKEYSAADKGVTKHAASEPLSMFYHQVVAKHATKCTSLQYYFNTFIWYLPCTEQVTKTQPKQNKFFLLNNMCVQSFCKGCL